MKKVYTVLVWILVILLAFAPLGMGISAIFGYSLVFSNYWILPIAAICVTAVLVLLSIVTKVTVEDKITPVLSSVITPCALVNTVCYVSQCGTYWLVLSLLMCIGCGYLTIRHGVPPVRAGALVMTAALVLPVCLICVLLTAVGNAQVNHIIETVDSPDGTYYAQIIHSDQGDMGGDTIVKVYSYKGLDAGLFRISRKPLRLYVGAEEEYKTMELKWISNDRLMIDEKEYFVKYK